MRIYKIKTFRRFQRKEGMTDAALCEAVKRAEDGSVDAKLGRNLIKQRVARQGAGRRGGFRTVIAYRVGTRAVFIYGFAKSKEENISAADEQDLAHTGALLLEHCCWSTAAGALLLEHCCWVLMRMASRR